MDVSTAAEGQRRQVSVLFADIVGFTATAERIGDEASFRLIQIVSARMMEAVHAQGGTVQEFRGDGIMALFGAPVALEDAPLRACRAALKIQETMTEIGDDLEARHGVRPRARVGVHAGQLVVGEVGDDRRMRFTAIGDTVNLAARLEAEAETGSIYVSEALYSLVRGQVDVTDAGQRSVKGKSKPQQMYRLDRMKEGVSRFDVSRTLGLTELQERDRELARLNEHLDSAAAGRFEIAHLVGEAGIGKSRLMHEFRKAIADREGVVFLQGDCRADGASTPFLPFVELVRAAFFIKKSDARADIEAKLKAGLEAASFNVADTLPYLMLLLSQDEDKDAGSTLSADIVGMRLRQVLMDLLWHTARGTAVVLFIEDLHWIDPGSEDLLHRMATAADRDIKLLLVCAFRPYYRPPWADAAAPSEIRLDPLTEAGTIRLLSERLGVSDLGAEMVRLAVEKVEGNPLYAEEIARFLQDRNTAAAAGNATADLVLPANLQNLVMDRFDRLGRDTRAMLQAASVAGRRFDSEMIRDLLGLDAPASELMAEAEHHELVRPIKDRGADYIFKHALVQDAIYDTLMAAARAKLHADVGLAIEAANAGNTDEVADTLAYHFELSNLDEKAVRYLAAAGRRGLSMFSLEVAERSFSRAVEVMETKLVDVDRELQADIFRDWFEVQLWRADFGNTIATFEPRREAIRALEGTRSYPNILAFLGVAYAQLLRFQEVEPLLQEAMLIAEERQDRETIAHACIGMMGLHCNRWSAEAFDAVGALYEKAQAAVDWNEALYNRMFAEFYRAWSHSQRGDMDIAREMGLASIAHGRARNYPGSVGFGCIACAYNESFSENYAKAITYAEEGARSAGGFVDQIICHGIKGLAMALSGDGENGLQLLRNLHKQIEEKQYLSMYNIVDMPTGVAMVTVGDLAAGVKWIEKSVATAKSLGNVHAAAMGHVVLGEIYLQLATGKEKPDPGVLRRNAMFLLRSIPFAKSKAIAHFDQAIELGRSAKMYGITAQALYDKGLALRASRKHEAARAVLTEAKAVTDQIRWKMITDKIDAALASF